MVKMYSETCQNRISLQQDESFEQSSGF